LYEARRVNVKVFVSKKGESKKGFVARIKPKLDGLGVVLDAKGFIKTVRPHSMQYHLVILTQKTIRAIHQAMGQGYR
jgi:hypothetical protein